MSKKHIAARLFAASLFGIAGASAANGAVISVNFVGGQTAAGGGPGAASVTTTAGAVAVGNWNNSATPAAGPVGLVDSTGGASGASLSYTSPNNWAANGTAPGGGGNAAMMNGYLDNFQNSPSAITVTGLPAAFTSGGYQVLVYQNADSPGSFGYTAADNAAHTDTRYGQQLTGGGGNYPLGGTDGFVGSTSTNSAGPGTAANYVILSGFTGSSFTISANSGTTGDGRVRPNGFQIVSVPEPTIGGLLGIASIAITARRRRKD